MPQSETMVRAGKGFVLNQTDDEYVVRIKKGTRFPSSSGATTMMASTVGKMAVYAEDNGPDWTFQLSFYRKPTHQDIVAMADLAQAAREAAEAAAESGS